MVARFRQIYGAGPLHLIGFLASALVAGAAVVGWFDNVSSLEVRIFVWFLGLVIAHDVIFLPLYSLADRLASRTLPRAGAGAARDGTPAWVYVRIPALLCGLLFLVFFPEILRLGDQTFHAASGLHQDVYLARYLLTCGVLFAASGVAYVVGRPRAVALERAEPLPVEEAAEPEPPHEPEPEPPPQAGREEAL